MPVIGFLSSVSPQPFANYVAGFRAGLKETGYIDGRNVTIEFRWAEGHYDRLPEMAAELVRHNVAVLVSTGGRTECPGGQGSHYDYPNCLYNRRRPNTRRVRQ